MDGRMFDGLASMFVFLMIAFLLLVLLGSWNIIDWLWIDDVYRTTVPIQPEIEYKVTNGTTIDTIYVYRFK